MSKTRILIVDDDPNLSRLSGIILESSGAYEVLTEQDSTRALAVARQFKPHVMLFDVDMPELDGGDLLRGASIDPILCNVPVLFITGLVTEAEMRSQFLRGDHIAFLCKPVSPDLLLNSVDKLLRNLPAG